MDRVDSAFNVPLKCTPEEKRHFVEPAMQEAQNANFPSALEIVTNGLDAHPASEGLLFLKAYFGYKVADTMSNELTNYPRVIQAIGNGALMIDGAMTSQMLSKFQEIVNTLTEAEEAINELLQVNPKSEKVVEFKGYIDQKRQQLDRESENMRATFTRSPQLAGSFCLGCQRSISYDTQKIVFRRTPDSRLEAWHFGCFQSASKN
ncbi:MAG TPA: hypothetical protein VE955_07440 [Candidatus Dormibacteraeota bacterium]|nr:hypothetical protein [Candidatus Dormibacteraeota bacterium]